MPVYDGYCSNGSCPSYRDPVEFMVKHWDDKSPGCPTCGVEVFRKIGTPNVVWAKPLGWYQGETGGSEGHTVYEKTEDGRKIKTQITTRQEQLAYCKRNGLYDPMEIPNDVNLSDSDTGRGEARQRSAWI